MSNNFEQNDYPNKENFEPSNNSFNLEVNNNTKENNKVQKSLTLNHEDSPENNFYEFI